MKPTIASKLAQLSARLEELNALLSSEDVTKNLENYRKLTPDCIGPWLIYWRQNGEEKRSC